MTETPVAGDDSVIAAADATISPAGGGTRTVSLDVDAGVAETVTVQCANGTQTDQQTATFAATAVGGCNSELGTFSAAGTTVRGTISADDGCTSLRRTTSSHGVYHARRHVLRLAHAGWVTVTLESDSVYPAGPDPYLLILTGDAADGSGSRLDANDDHGSSNRTHRRNSRIADRFLPKGTYTIEATTRHPHSTRLPASTTGDYTLTVTADHTPRVPQHPARLTAQVGRTLRASWGHEPDSAAVRLWRPHPIRPGLDAAVSVGYLGGEHVSGAIRVKLEATATIPGEHTLSFVYDNGGHTATKHTTITAECTTGQVTLPLGCVTPVPAKRRQVHHPLSPTPTGHEEAIDCLVDGLPSGPRVYTCRRLVESREYVSKADPRILAASEPSILDNKYGRTLIVEVAGQTEPEQFEGCQSLSDQYWQCDYYADLLWYRTVLSGSTWDYYWSAFVSGVVRPTACAVKLIALQYGGASGAQAIAGAILTCRPLFTRVEPNTLEDEE